MNEIYKYPIYVAIDKGENVRCKALRDIYFSKVHSIGLNYPCFNGRAENVLGDIYFSDCTFERKDELDGEKSPGTPMTCEYADNLHFASTKFI